jgi:hypothetical protein
MTSAHFMNAQYQRPVQRTQALVHGLAHGGEVPDERLAVVAGGADVAGGVGRPGQRVDARLVPLQLRHRERGEPDVQHHHLQSPAATARTQPPAVETLDRGPGTPAGCGRRCICEHGACGSTRKLPGSACLQTVGCHLKPAWCRV